MNTNGPTVRGIALAILSALAMVGCTVGPDFVPPKSVTPDVFERTQTAQAPSKPVEADFNPDWWTLFDDPVLNTLEQRLAGANLDVAAASARLRQSRAEQRVAGAAALPTLGGAASYNRERGSENGIFAARRDAIAEPATIRIRQRAARCIGDAGVQGLSRVRPVSGGLRCIVGTRYLGPRAPQCRSDGRLVRRFF